MDEIWGRSEVSRKEEIATLLLAHEEELAVDFYGGIVLRNCNIAHFKKRQAGWIQEQETAKKKRDIFKDIISEEGAGGAVGVAALRKKRTASREDIVPPAKHRKKVKKK